MWLLSPGTSGDTGGSAIQSAKGLSGLDVVVVYPRGRITPVQEKQMITCLEDNVHVFAGKNILTVLCEKGHQCVLLNINGMCLYSCTSAADGSSDDIDQPLRCLFADQELVKSHSLMSLNSVNWSRIMIQLTHFIYAYLELSDMGQTECDGALPELEVVVPTGGAGNITGELITSVGIFVTIICDLKSHTH